MSDAFANASKFAEELGFKVFPCWPGDKRPLTEHGLKDASNDPNQLLQWNKKFPKANWAVATGSESGVFVVDIDSPEADTWFDSQWIPEGAVIETPRGGRHIYYLYDGTEVDLGSTRSKIYPKIDTRGNGGYALLPGSATSKEVDPTYGDGPYVGDFDDMIEVPAALIDLIPEKQTFESLSDSDFAEAQTLPKPENVSPQEERVLAGYLNLLGELPTPWHPGAGWHSTGFFVACSLWRVINSPDYATTENDAYNLYMESVPRRREDPADIWDKRWNSAREQVGNQIAEPPGDVPIRLDAEGVLDKYTDSTVQRLFWESKKIRDVRELIRSLRALGATDQEAYSVSYECAAMKRIRKDSPGKSVSTWGFVKSEYETARAEAAEVEPVQEQDVGAWTPETAEKGKHGTPLRLLSEEERDVVRDYPNYVDYYMGTAKAIFAEPNLPLHYLNAWIALSMSIGDSARLYLESGSKPLSLWGLEAAPSASGKTDAYKFMLEAVDASRTSGVGSVNLGDDVSAEALAEAVLDRNGSATAMLVDEAAELLTGFHQPNSYYHKVMGECLRLYDGKVSRALRKGMDKAQVGESSDASFTLWMQAPTSRILDTMSESDLESGLVGRFLVAFGDDVNVTRESLKMNFASEYQVQNGRNPLVDAFTGCLRNSAQSIVRGAGMGFASEEVEERVADGAVTISDFAKAHPLRESLLGIFIRLSENVFKGACLIALSEGRTLVEMEDYLLALKSGEHWIKSMLELVDGISMSEYRQLVEYVTQAVAQRPRTQRQLLTLPRLRDVKMFEVNEIIERAEREGRIVKREGSPYWDAPDE